MARKKPRNHCKCDCGAALGDLPRVGGRAGAAGGEVRVQLHPEMPGLVDLGLVDLDLELIESRRGEGGGADDGGEEASCVHAVSPAPPRQRSPFTS